MAFVRCWGKGHILDAFLRPDALNQHLKDLLAGCVEDFFTEFHVIQVERDADLRGRDGSPSGRVGVTEQWSEEQNQVRGLAIFGRRGEWTNP